MSRLSETRGTWLSLTLRVELFYPFDPARRIPRWRAVLQLPGGQVKWSCEHEHHSDHAADRCGKARLNALRRAAQAARLNSTGTGPPSRRAESG